jgi:UDP-N-acetylglucosamine 2-epimerase (non-hydrolysing)
MVRSKKEDGVFHREEQYLADRTDQPTSVMVVAGARPNFMKIAPVLKELDSRRAHTILVHTGQHYDDEMSASFFRDLEIREPDYHLGVGSATHAVQTARIMEAFEPLVLRHRPDWVLVPGDVNSTIACALVSVKLREETGTRLAHLEAGLRSHDWRMPEEVNRVLTDRCSHLLLIPSWDAADNLKAEGIDPDRITFVGNVMIDTLLGRLPAARRLDVASRMGLKHGGYAVATLHRPSNVDEPDALQNCLEAFNAVTADRPLVLPLHPRTRKQVEAFGFGAYLDGLRVTEPLPYLDMLSLVDASALVLTDSGGIQEETTVLGVPCVTLREQTERPVTVEEGTNRLAPWPLSVAGIGDACTAALAQGRVGLGDRSPEGWDGNAAKRAVDALLPSR